MNDATRKRLITSAAIPRAEKALLKELLAHHHDGARCFPGLDRLCELLDIRARQLRNLRKSLKDRGILREDEINGRLHFYVEWRILGELSRENRDDTESGNILPFPVQTSGNKVPHHRQYNAAPSAENCRETGNKLPRTTNHKEHQSNPHDNHDGDDVSISDPRKPSDDLGHIEADDLATIDRVMTIYDRWRRVDPTRRKPNRVRIIFLACALQARRKATSPNGPGALFRRLVDALASGKPPGITDDAEQQARRELKAWGRQRGEFAGEDPTPSRTDRPARRPPPPEPPPVMASDLEAPETLFRRFVSAGWFAGSEANRAAFSDLAHRAKGPRDFLRRVQGHRWERAKKNPATAGQRWRDENSPKEVSDVDNASFPADPSPVNPAHRDAS